MRNFLRSALVAAALLPPAAFAQTSSPAQSPRPAAVQPAVVPAVNATAEPGFTIGPEDVLGIVFWRDQDMSGDVTVRPDGMITVPLIRDVKAAGLTPNELADRIQTAARQFVKDAAVTVVVRHMNSRKVFITGEVAHPGAYALASRMTVMQLISLAGGLTEFAHGENIVIIRSAPAGQALTFHLNYKDIVQRRNLDQNIDLRSGDTVVVPER